MWRNSRNLRTVCINVARFVQGARSMSNLPESPVYGGPKSKSPWKRVTLRHLEAKYQANQPITMVTAYDYPSGVHVDRAGIDIILVGDSVGIVVHGHDTTLPVTMDDMLLHCKAVARDANRPLFDWRFTVWKLRAGHAACVYRKEIQTYDCLFSSPLLTSWKSSPTEDIFSVASIDSWVNTEVTF